MFSKCSLCNMVSWSQAHMAAGNLSIGKTHTRSLYHSNFYPEDGNVPNHMHNRWHAIHQAWHASWQQKKPHWVFSGHQQRKSDLTQFLMHLVFFFFFLNELNNKHYGNTRWDYILKLYQGENGMWDVRAEWFFICFHSNLGHDETTKAMVVALN